MIFICLLMVLYIVLCLLTFKSNLYYDNNSSNNIKKLVRQTARWATAGDQDENGYIANLHATYAMGYLMALREIYSDTDIEKYSGIDIRQFEVEISKIMDKAIKKLVIECPNGQPKNRYLASISKEGMLLNSY